MPLRHLLATVGLIAVIASCQQSSTRHSTQASRPLTNEEAVQDFRQIVETFRTHYGPWEYKEKLFGYSIDAFASEIETQLKSATSDDQYFGLYAKFLARLQDGHVGIRFPMNSTGATVYSVPVFVVPVGNTFLVADVVEKIEGTTIARGDEVLTVDGRTPEELLKIILQYQAFATPESNRHWVYKILARDFYMTELRPTKNTVTVTFKKPDGRVLSENFTWKVRPWAQEKFVVDGRPNFIVPAMEELNDQAGNSLLKMADPKPFFATEEVLKAYGFRAVTADEEHRKKYELKEKENPNIHAYLYKFEGKTVLLVRSYIYSHADLTNVHYLKGYKAILDQWEELADVLVLDQTHNGGGIYCEEFARLFLKEEKDGFVQALNVDRKWIVDLRGGRWGQGMEAGTGRKNEARVYDAMGAEVELGYDNGSPLTRPLPVIGGQNKITPADYTWKKPMLVLVDELAGSCGDAFPMLIKNNKVATIFGKRTMGLGGNVEGFVLRNSQTQVRLTRGLFTSHRDDGAYAPNLWIENNGVEPDLAYDHTVEDFRKGFVGYVKAFSEAALKEIK